MCAAGSTIATIRVSSIPTCSKNLAKPAATRRPSMPIPKRSPPAAHSTCGGTAGNGRAPRSWRRTAQSAVMSSMPSRAARGTRTATLALLPSEAKDAVQADATTRSAFVSLQSERRRQRQCQSHSPASPKSRSIPNGWSGILKPRGLSARSRWRRRMASPASSRCSRRNIPTLSASSKSTATRRRTRLILLRRTSAPTRKVRRT